METVIIKSMLYPHPMICGNCKYRVPTKQKSYIRTLQALNWNEVPALGYCYCLNCGAKFIGIRDEKKGNVRRHVERGEFEMKGYKAAYSPSEVAALEKKAVRHGVRMSLETIYSACCLAMLDHDIGVETVTEIAQTANGVLESILYDNTKLKDIQDTIKEDYGLVLNFYGSDTTTYGERGKIK